MPAHTTLTTMLAAAVVFGLASANVPAQAVLTIEVCGGITCHNSTLTAPLNEGPLNLNPGKAVSNIFLSGIQSAQGGATLDASKITCTASGPGTHRAPRTITSTMPALLSTNTVMITSIDCKYSGSGVGSDSSVSGKGNSTILFTTSQLRPTASATTTDGSGAASLASATAPAGSSSTSSSSGAGSLSSSITGMGAVFDFAVVGLACGYLL